jgi:hypothetical protein
MNGALLVLVAIVTVTLAAVLVMHMQMAAADRREWAEERRALVDRAIAAHAGEIVALDRASNGGRVREEREQINIEGLS